MTTATKYKPYSKYKPSGIDWLGDIPDGWESWKVAHLFNKIGSGTTPPSEDMDYYEGDIPWVITGELKDNEIFDSENKVTKKAVQELSALKIFPKDSLLIAMYGATIGKMAILRIPATTNQACCVLGDSKLIDTDFSFYYFLSFRPHLIALSYGGGQPNISQDTIRSIKIFLPVISEQKKIADFLDRETAKIDVVVAKKQKLIELFKEKRQAIISQAVTKGLNPKAKMKDSGIEWLGNIPERWKVKRLKYVSNTRVSNVDKKSEDEIQVRLCNYIDVYKNEFINERIDFMIATATSGQISAFELKTGDVIITKDSETADDIGIPAHVDLEDTKNVVCGYHLAIATPNDSALLGKYLFRLFQSNIFRSYFEVSSHGVTRFGLDSYSIFNANITLPSLPEQRAIADFLDRETEKINELVRMIKLQNQKLQEFRQVLISNVVTGKIKI